MKVPCRVLVGVLSVALVVSACGSDGMVGGDGGVDAGGDGGGAACDPVRQTGCGAGQGCYVLITSTSSVATCAAAGTVGVGQKITGQPFANSCVPGAIPRRPSSGSLEWECGGICVPADVVQGENEALEGGTAEMNCQTKWGAKQPGEAGGESCRYWWARETFKTPSPFSNTLGFCFPHGKFQYDSNDDQRLDAAWPRCIGVTRGDVLPPVTNPPGNDALSFWCVAEPG